MICVRHAVVHLARCAGKRLKMVSAQAAGKRQ